MKTCRLVYATLTRMALATFAILAGLAIPEARGFHIKQPKIDGSVFYFPLIVCKPSQVDVEGTVMTLDDQGEIGGCHTLSYLVNACVMSFVFSIAAILLFIAMDLLSIKWKSSLKGAVVGMGLFLALMLLQSAVITWALANEGNFWEDYYRQTYGEDYADNGIKEITMYGNSTLLMATGAMAVITALFLFVETFIKFCWTDDDDDDDEPAAKPQQQQQPAITNGTTTPTRVDPENPPATIPVETATPSASITNGVGNRASTSTNTSRPSWMNPFGASAKSSTTTVQQPSTTTTTEPEIMLTSAPSASEAPAATTTTTPTATLSEEDPNKPSWLTS